MIDELNFDAALKADIKVLIELKAGKAESYVHPAEPDINCFIQQEVHNAEQAFASLPGRKQKDVDLDSVFRDIVMNY
jgi:hypothetical protein